MSTNLDPEIRIKSHLIQKHDLEVNWNKAISFVPHKGQLIIYDIEVDEDGNTLKDTEEKVLLPEGRVTPYTYERIKIGDGINIVSDLPFVDTALRNEIIETYATKTEIDSAASDAQDKADEAEQNAKDYTDEQLVNKLDIYNNITAARQVYGTVNGQQIMVPVSTAEYTASALVSRDANGFINTKTPTAATQATNKQYVDDLAATKIQYNDVIQNTSPFGGKKLYINSVDNAFAAINKKFWVKVTYHKCTDDNGVEYPHVKEGAAKTDADYWVDGPSAGATLDFGSSGIDELFNNTYEGGKRIPLNSYMKVHIRFSNEEGWTPSTGTAVNSVYGSYPYGTFYISYYYQNRPSATKRSQYRCYNNGSTHGYGWKKLDFSLFRQNSDGKTNTIESCTDGGNNARTCMEFIIFSDDTIQAGPTEIEWNLSRPTFNQNSPLLHNYGSNNVYYNMYFRTKKTEEATISLTPDGIVTAKTVVAKNAPTGANHVTNKQYVDDAISTAVATKTSVTLGGVHQETFSADNLIVKTAENQTINGNLAITGDLTVAGKMAIQETETLQIKDNIIEVNSNKINNFTAQSGVVINKNSSSAYGILYDPVDDTVKLGLGINNSEIGFSFNENEGSPLAVRDDSEQILEDQAILVFDKAKNKLVYSGFTLESFRASIMAEMKAYLEEYMSTEIEIDENGNTITSLNLTGTEESIDNGDGSQTLKITTGGNN